MCSHAFQRVGCQRCVAIDNIQVCLELNQTWMESGVSEDAVSGHIQVRLRSFRPHPGQFNGQLSRTNNDAACYIGTAESGSHLLPCFCHACRSLLISRWLRLYLPSLKSTSAEPRECISQFRVMSLVCSCAGGDPRRNCMLCMCASPGGRLRYRRAHPQARGRVCSLATYNHGYASHILASLSNPVRCSPNQTFLCGM